MRRKNRFPIIYDKKRECCGCTACSMICPKGAISMVEDEEGVDYPKINDKICIQCNACLRVCPFKNTI